MQGKKVWVKRCQNSVNVTYGYTQKWILVDVSMLVGFKCEILITGLSGLQIVWRHTYFIEENFKLDIFFSQRTLKLWKRYWWRDFLSDYIPLLSIVLYLRQWLIAVKNEMVWQNHFIKMQVRALVKFDLCFERFIYDRSWHIIFWKSQK